MTRPSAVSMMLALTMACAPVGCDPAADADTTPADEEDADTEGNDASDAGEDEAEDEAEDDHDGANATQPRGFYWSWAQTWRFIITPDGFGSSILVFQYVFRLFDESGFVYVGDPRPDRDEMKCTAERQDEYGYPQCVRFVVEDGMITIGDDDPVPLAKDGSHWTIGEDVFEPIPSFEGMRLDGTYHSIDCFLATCTTAIITFTEDGRYEEDVTNVYANTLGDIFVGASGGSSSGGTYAIGRQSIEITPVGGAPRSVFFFREQGGDSDTIQLADTWFDRQ